MIGKILCKLGVHSWYRVKRAYYWKHGLPFKRYETRCKKCDKLKQRDYLD